MWLRIPSPVPVAERRVGFDLRAWRRAGWSMLWLIFSLVASGIAHAASDRIDVQQASFESRDDGYYFSGDFDLDLKPRVADALEHGLTLYFVVEAELTRSRWYWFDEKAVNAVLNYRLSYHALTRQYRVSTGNLQLGFATLAEAIGVMTHVRDWKVADHDTLKPGQTYAAAVRMRLDTTQLPKPFQINAITSRDWTLESDWKRFAFEPR
jgi:hypothetical protein